MREIGRRESDAILGAMRQVALAGGHAISHADTASILGAAHYLLRRRDLSDIGTLGAVEPGDLVAALKADAELIVVHHPGYTDQSVYRLGLRQKGAAVQIDDTVFATASHGVILVSDRDGETVYAISRNIFSPGAAYSATPTSVAELNQDTGVLTDIVTGLVSPHGMAFISHP